MPANDDEMFVVEGKLKELQIAPTAQNLLEPIKKHPHAKVKGFAGGVVEAGAACTG